MNFRTTFFLLIAVAIVGGAALWFSRAGQDAEPVATDSRRLLNVLPAEVSHIELTASDGKKVALDRRSTGWRMASPVVAGADDAFVESLLSSLTTMSSQGQVKLDGNETAIGLSPPANVVSLATRDRVIKLSIGERSGTGGSVYVRVDDRPHADLVPAVVLGDLERPATAFRDLNVVSLTPADVSHVTITDAKENSTVELRRAAGVTDEQNAPAWRIVQPFDAPADPAEASDIVFALARLRAADFVDEPGDLSRFELASPQLTVTLETSLPTTTQPAATSSADRSVTIRFGKFEDALRENVYAAVTSGEQEAPTVVTVPSAVLSAVRKRPIDLRDRVLLSLDPQTVRRITVAHEPSSATQPAAQTLPATVVIERVSEPTTQDSTTQPSTAPATRPAVRWTFANDQAPVDEQLVDELLASFRPFRVDRYLPTLNFVAVPSAVVVTLETTDGKTHTVRLYPADVSPEPPQGQIPPPSPVHGSYNDLYFEVPGFVLERLRGPFVRG